MSTTGEEKLLKEKSSSRRLNRIKRFVPLYLLMLPAYIYLFINNYLPMAGLVLAFKKYNVKAGIFRSPWNGFTNFGFLLKNKTLPIIIRNTLGYNIIFIIINLILGVLLAIIITELPKGWFRKLSQSAVLMPFVISIIIISYMVRAFLDPEAGLLNHIILYFGGKKISWYDTSKYWPFILTYVNTWKGVGYGTILYISAILGIDQSLFESAAMDGATKMQQIRYITIPLIKPTMITILLLNIGRIFNSDFGLFYQVPQNSGLIQNVTQTIDTFVYRSLLVQNNIGLSSAASFFQSILGFVMVLFFNGLTRRISKENSLF